MKRSLLIVTLAGLVVSAGAWLFAQSGKTAPSTQPPPNSAIPFGTFESSHGTFDPSQPQPAQSPAQPSQPTAKPEGFTSSPSLKTTTVEAINLRNRYIELSKKKALLMQEDQLKREIETLERQIPELEAWAKAEEAVRLLREVIEKHPNTEAAKCAQSAIELIQGRGEDFKREDFVPRPVDGPRPRDKSGPTFDSGSPPNGSRRAAPSVPVPTDGHFRRDDFQLGPDRDRLSS
jgi:ribosomal protein L31E